MENLPAVVTTDEILKQATLIAKSRLFGVKTVEEAASLMLVAQAEGLHPAIAARDYHIIEGRPTLKADAMLARFQQSGGSVQWLKHTDQEVSAIFAHPQGGKLEISWTMERANKAGLTGKDNWKKYPRQMLRARVISEGIRNVFPGRVVGVYTPEEIEDDIIRPAARETEATVETVKPEAPKSDAPKQTRVAVLEKQIGLAIEAGFKDSAIAFMNRELGAINKTTIELSDAEADSILAKLKTEAKTFSKDANNEKH
jgi:hypothetical protein